jgi:single-stranded-DNA-specific exonuclease
MQKVWKFKEPDTILQKIFSDSLGITPYLAQVLINRGISTLQEVRNFLTPHLSNLHDPNLLKDMDKAIDRIKKAIRLREKILIFGDYDVDGIASVALLKRTFSQLGANILHYIPHRIQEGYGLNQEAIRYALANKVSLLITVDCGISASDEINELNRFKIDTIILDHHQPYVAAGLAPAHNLEEKLPAACAVINPKRKDCPYPYKELSGVGLAFKFLQALCPSEDLIGHLDLVCLGTVADVVPLTGENRILVKHGLSYLNKTKKVGLRALIGTSGLSGKEISPSFIGYILGPRINAAGRLGSAERSLQLLLTESTDEAEKIAGELNQENRNRQKLEDQTLQEAMAKIESEVNFKDHKVIVLHQDNWHPGVIGIVASRLVERFYRPTIIISFKETIGRGSGRSIKNFHLFDALSKCQDLLEGYGGHAYAAGLTLLKENLTRFQELINKIAHQTILGEDLLPTLEIDAEIPLGALSEEFILEIETLAPFGTGNPKPIFSSRALELKNSPQIVGRDSLKMWISDGRTIYPAIGFKMAEFISSISEDKRYDLAYTPSLDDWQGGNAVQLEIKDIHPSTL